MIIRKIIVMDFKEDYDDSVIQEELELAMSAISSEMFQSGVELISVTSMHGED